MALACVLAAAALGARYGGTALVVSEPTEPPDAVLSLGSHEWERLPLAAAIALQHPGALVLLTLPRRINPFNCHDCARRTDRLRELGVDPGRVRILPLEADNTYGEALVALPFARESRIEHLLLVTSPYHTRRSLATFRSVFDGTGIEIGVVPAMETSPTQPARWWSSPYDRAYVRYEWAALAYYTLRHGVVAWDDRVAHDQAGAGR